MISDQRLKEYVQLCIDLKLAGYKYLVDLPFEEIKCLANGIGPERFHPKLRAMIDTLNPTLVVVSVLHDIRYSHGDGTLGDFYQANADLEINGCLVAKHLYKWYNIRRYWVMFKAHEFRVICDDFGWDAYVSAIQNHTTCLRRRNEPCACES